VRVAAACKAWEAGSVPRAPPASTTLPAVMDQNSGQAEQFQPGVLIDGSVKTWNDERGFGFLVPSNGGPDVFCHRSVLTDGHSLQVGSTVMFQAGFDQSKGKPTVKSCSGAVPLREGLGGAPGEAMGGEGMHTGTVRTWIEERGMGFIAPDDGSQDLFVHRSFLNDGVSLTVGSQVSFEPDFDEAKNKHTAKNVYGAFGSAAGTGPNPAVAAALAQAAQIVNAGFAKNDLTSAMASLASAQELLMRHSGAAAQYPSSYGAVAAPRGVAPVAPYAYGGRGPPAPPPAVMPGRRVPGAPAHGGRMIGIVRQWNDQRGMGFIAPNAGGEDYFVHRSFLVDGTCLYEGATVQFDPSWDPAKNKATAKNVTGCFTSGDGASPVQASFGHGAQPQVLLGRVQPQAHHGFQSGMQNGVVTKWDEARGMGFLTPESGGTDVFVHRCNLADGNSLEQGAYVVFEGSWDAQKNKPIAKNVTGAHDNDLGSPSVMGAGGPPLGRKRKDDLM